MFIAPWKSCPFPASLSHHCFFPFSLLFDRVRWKGRKNGTLKFKIWLMIYRNCICIKLYLLGGEEEEKGCNYIFYSVKLQNQNSLSNLTSILHSGFTPIPLPVSFSSCVLFRRSNLSHRFLTISFLPSFILFLDSFLSCIYNHYQKRFSDSSRINSQSRLQF